MLLLNVLAIFFITIIIIYLLIKLLFKILCIKYDLIINFNFENFYKLKNIIIKSKSNKFHINCKKLWLSIYNNSYFNKNLKNKKITICANNLFIKINLNLYENDEESDGNVHQNNNNNSQKQAINLFIKLLKYFSITLKNTQIEIVNFKKLKFYHFSINNINIYYENFNENFLKINLNLNNFVLKSFYINQNDTLFNYLLEHNNMEFINDDKILNKSFLNLKIVDLNFINILNKHLKILNSIKMLVDKMDLNINENMYELNRLLLKRILNNNNSRSVKFDNKLIWWLTKIILCKLNDFNISFVDNQKFELNELEIQQPSILNEDIVTDMNVNIYTQQMNELFLNTSTILDTNQNLKLLKLTVKNIFYIKSSNADATTKLLFLKKFQLLINLVKNINISSLCESTNIFLNLNLIQNFVDEFLFQTKNIQQTMTTTTSTTTTKNLNYFIKYFKKRQLFFEIKCLNSYLTLSANNSSYIYGCKMCLFKYSSIKTQFSNDKYVEFLLKNFILTPISNFKHYLNTNIDANIHYYNTLINFGRVELKYQVSLNKSYLNISLDSMNIEYNNHFSIQLLNFLNKYEKVFEKLNGSMKKIVVKNEMLVKNDKNQQLQLKLNLKLVNLLLKFHKNLYLLFNINEFNYKNASLNMNKIKCVRIINKSNHFLNITKISDEPFLSVNNVNLINKMESFNINCMYLNLIDVKLNYSFNLHLILRKIIENFKKLNTRLNELIKPPSTTPTTAADAVITKNSKLNLIIENEFLINLIFDYSEDESCDSKQKETVTLLPRNFYLFFHTSSSDLKVNFTHLSGFIVKKEFLTINNFSLTFSKKDLSLHYERKYMKTQLEVNRLCKINMNLFHVNFFSEYNFAKLFDHWVNLRKCLIASMTTTATTTSNDQMNLPPDLLIKANSIKLEIEDDPFEVKLSYNYALLVDEQFESVKRRKQLDDRRLIKENHLESAAYEILKELEANVYLQRSKKFYEKPIRTQLFTMSLTDACFYALADYKWYGHENCVKLIKTIDTCSPLQTNPKYSLLWSRYVNLLASDFRFVFRDYTQPYIQSQNFHLWGNLIVAEMEPIPTARREIQMKFSDTDFEYLIIRSMAPIKIYHDWCSKMSLYQMAYGPCKEACMAEINLAIDRIIHPTRDPTYEPLPWWDKMRLYLHGRLSINTEQTILIYHVSMDPYNRTEEMKWIWKDLYFDWFNSKMLFKGDLDVYLHTASKYDDCCILNWPNLEMSASIEWLCKQNLNPNSHNYVMMYSPDKVPATDVQKHDSFANFRSINLNLNLSFVCTTDKTQGIIKSPTLKFYASTLRFLQRIRDLLTSVTRPIKRGELFQTTKPRKPLLSRHYNMVISQFDIPKLNILYWTSASEQYGIQVDCKKFYLNITHKLNIVNLNGALKRRSQGNWIIETMRCRTTKTIIYLMSPSNEHKLNVSSFTSSSASSTTSFDYNIDSELIMENERSIKLLDSKPAFRNFFLQVDVISYTRENKLDLTTARLMNNTNKKSSLSSSSDHISHTPPPLHNAQIKNLKAKWNNINRDVVFTLYDIYNRANLLRHNLSTQALKHFIFIENNDLNTSMNTVKMTNASSFVNNINSPAHQQQQQNSDLNNTSFLSSQDQFKDSYVEEMLEKLESERGINSEIYTDEKPNDYELNSTDSLYGVHATTKISDVLHQNVHIELINCQIKMNLQQLSTLTSNNLKPKKKTSFNSKLNEQANNNPRTTPIKSDHQQNDYLIISAAKANIIRRIHKPVFKSQRLLDKFSWTGHLESMQYFATLPTEQQDANTKDDSSLNDEYWLDAYTIDPSENLNKENNDYGNKNDFFDFYCAKNPLGMIIIPKYTTEKSMDSKISSAKTMNTIDEHDEKSKYTPKLQLIVSKCRCEFYMIDFNDKIIVSDDNIEENLINTGTLLNTHLDLNSSFKEPIDCFTLIHYDLNLCTNSQQYKMILEIVNNLVLYFRPKRKHVIDRQRSIKFNLQLTGDIDSLKQHIQQQQISIKETLCKLRLLERQLFYSTEKIQAEVNSLQNLTGTNRQNQMNIIQELKNENKSMEIDYKECKKLLSEMSDELNITISCYKELILEKRITNPLLRSKIILDGNLPSSSKIFNQDKKSDEIGGKKYFDDEYTQKSIISNDIGRRYEILFKHTQWKLTESDGIVGCAQFTMKNFLYTKLVNQLEVDCVVHNLEIGSCKIEDLTPDQHIYNDVLSGQFIFDDNEFNENYEITDTNNSSTMMVRIFCKQRPPVGEISVFEHLELNLTPLTIKLTHRFYLMMMKFFFPVVDIKNKSLDGQFDSSFDSILDESQYNFKINDSYTESNRASLNLDTVNVNQQQLNEYFAQNQLQSFHKKSKSFSNNFIINTNTAMDLHNDDIEIMKRRSANNNTFICIKIPEIPLLVSYKGNKDKNIQDLNNVNLLFPLFEVYNKTCTWLDLINALKSHIKKALLSQAIKHKLIKIPIKPVNRLINRKRNKNTNGDFDEHEKNAITKMFGSAKLMEKKSSTITVTQNDDMQLLPMNPSMSKNKLAYKNSQIVSDDLLGLSNTESYVQK